ncbi:MAG: hypothetical protein H6711_04150 [Myxococcales bacterium]|nr:hypothetical protein [Myxococcales bacterium]
MRPTRRTFLALTTGLAGGLVGGLSGCGGLLRRPIDAPRCGEPGERLATLDLPFSPGHESFAGWLGEGAALIAELTPEGALQAALVDVEARSLRPLGGPIAAPDALPPNLRATFIAADARVAAIARSTLAAEPIAAAILDAERGAITRVASDGAPTSAAFLSTPLASVRVGARWALWPRLTGPEAARHAPGSGHVLDLAAARWRPAPALPLRQGAHLAALPDGRVALWGGSEGGVLCEDGVLLDLDAGEVGRFPHPALPTTLQASDGLVLAAVDVNERGVLSGYLLDLGRGALIPLERRLDPSWRNRRVLHLRGDRLAYLAREGLHLWERSTRRWRTIALPFAADAPGDVTIHDMVDGTWLLSGSERGDFILDPASGECCQLGVGTSLEVVSAVITSARDRIYVGGAAVIEETPDCPPGAPCAQPEPRQVEDRRLEIVRLR